MRASFVLGLLVVVSLFATLAHCNGAIVPFTSRTGNILTAIIKGVIEAPIQTTASNNPSRVFPTDVTDGPSWTGYGIYLGLVIVIPLLVGIICYIMCCCACWCTCCCTSGRYYKEQIIPCAVPYLILYVLIICCSVVTIVCVIYVAVTANPILTNGFTVMNKAAGIVDSVVSAANDLNSGVDKIFDSVNGIISGAGEIRAPLSNMVVIINSSIAESTKIKNNITDINKQYAIIQDKAKYLSGDGVPAIDLSAIKLPDLGIVADGVVGKLTDIRKLIEDGDGQAAGIISGLSTQVGSMKTDIKAQIAKLQDSVKTSLQPVQTAIDANFNANIRGQIRDGVTAGYIVIAIVLCLFFALTLFMYTCGFTSLCCRCSCCLNFVIAYTNVVIIILLLLCSLLTVIYFGGTDICTQHKTILANAENTVLAKMNLNIPIKDLKISEAAIGVISCGAGQTYLQAAGLDNIDRFFNISAQIAPQKKILTDQVSKFDFSTILANSTQNINNFVDTVQINMTLINQMITVLDQVEAALNSYSNLSRSTWGINMTLLNDGIVQFNENNRLAGFTTIQFVLANVSSWSSTASPWSAGSAQYKQLQTDLQTKLVEVNTKYTSALNKIEEAKVNVTAMKFAAYNISADAYMIKSSVDTIKLAPGQVTSQLSSVGVVANKLVANATNFIDYAVAILKDSIVANSALQCSFVGDMYRNVMDLVCDKSANAVVVCGYACFVYAIVLIFFMPCTCGLSRRIQRYQRPDAASHSTDYLKNPKVSPVFGK